MSLTPQWPVGLKSRDQIWLCLCSCGNLTITRLANIKNGHAKSCGCLRLRSITKHGHSKRGSGRTSEYITWCCMIQRCTDPQSDNWHLYGGRGVRICRRWRDFNKFLSDMGKRPKGKTLDRMNTNGNYEPKNCRWATPKEQAQNRRPRTPSL